MASLWSFYWLWGLKMTDVAIVGFASGLLILRLISLYFVFYVIYKQLKIWNKVKKSKVVEKAIKFRALLFALAVAMLLKNIVPVGIDVVAIVSLGEVTLSMDKLSDSIIVQYFTSNAIFDLIMSSIIWLLYREARRYK